ncbi:MAG: alpha/beta fold hydrolase [Alphaproteobacteria bacterium]
MQKSLQNAAFDHASEVLNGILRYMEMPYKTPSRDVPVLWKQGNARLLDYSSLYSSPRRGEGKMLLFVPSLINRYYILDMPGHSMLEYMARQGFRPLVLDWGVPGKFETGFGCNEYIGNILLPTIDNICKTTGQPVTLAGYCMGGVFSLAAAQLMPKKVSALALLATPWDFHCKAFAPYLLDSSYQQMMAGMLKGMPIVPSAMIQSLFYLTDPLVFEHKFSRFFSMDPKSAAAKEFLALEHWVNDGVPMTVKLAHDCLLGWAQGNQLAKGMWEVAGKTIDPKKLNIPLFMAIPKNDHVVPYDCAVSLANMMKNPFMVYPDTGHVSMVMGSRAQKELWNPLAGWLKSLS